MAFYVAIAVVLILVSSFALRKRHDRQTGQTLTGGWYCHYQHPYVWGDKTKEGLPFSAEYFIVLKPNGEGEMRNVQTPDDPKKTVYFTWVIENDHIIVDSEKWDSSSPIYFKILQLTPSACHLRVFFSAEGEESTGADTFRSPLSVKFHRGRMEFC